MEKQEEIILDGAKYIREDLMEAVIRQYRIERDEALEHICSKNERAFLDEIREKGKQYSFYAGEYRDTYIEIGESKLEQKDFVVDLRDFADEQKDEEILPNEQ